MQKRLSSSLTDICKNKNKHICNFSFVLCACEIWFYPKRITKSWDVLDYSAEESIWPTIKVRGNWKNSIMRYIICNLYQM
jgi:hypothetical protein